MITQFTNLFLFSSRPLLFFFKLSQPDYVFKKLLKQPFHWYQNQWVHFFLYEESIDWI